MPLKLYCANKNSDGVDGLKGSTPEASGYIVIELPYFLFWVNDVMSHCSFSRLLAPNKMHLQQYGLFRFDLAALYEGKILFLLKLLFMHIPLWHGE